MSADRNLLFAVLALQADCVNREQFIDACTAWAANKAMPIDALMVQKGWLTPEDRSDVERLVERKLKKHGGNVRQSLAESAGEDVRQSLAAVPDSDLRQSLAAGLPAEFVGLATLPLLPSSASNRYRLSRVHATGGLGRVWLAQDTAIGRSVALKELRPERAGEQATIERFVKEARITGQLEHPGIVPIYELAHRPQDNEPFYTMRFIRGRTLAAAIRRFHEPKLPPPALAFRELLTAFLGACNAVAYAHSRGVIHRDLKPANIVLGDYGEVIVLDWGMAKVLSAGTGQDQHPAPQAVGLATQAEPPPRIEPSAADDDQASAGIRLGTPAYMPPEQAEGRQDLHDQRSDVYALGAILYEILTGAIPFDADDTDALLEKVCREPPPSPRARKRDVPRALEAVCLKALAKRREDRFPTALALAGDVQGWLADEPVQCYAEPLSVRAGRWARKHKPVVVTAGAVLLTATLGLAVGLYFVNAERNRTELARQKLGQLSVALIRLQSENETIRKEVRRNHAIQAAAKDLFAGASGGETAASVVPEMLGD
jgi:serine/threonine protein kinase